MEESKLDKVINELNNLPTTVYCGFYQLRMTHNLRDETIKLLKQQQKEIEERTKEASSYAELLIKYGYEFK